MLVVVILHGFWVYGVGSGLPSILFLKDKSKAMKVGIGMISRGEVGLIVDGVGITSGILTTDVHIPQ